MPSFFCIIILNNKTLLIFYYNQNLAYTIDNLTKHLESEEMTPKKIKAGGRKSNTKVHTFEDVERAVAFILKIRGDSWL